MNKKTGTHASKILQPANLLSLSRILLAPFIGYYLWRGDSQATAICITLLIVAGITDFLDGYLARRLGQVSRLGMVLDPLADKTLAVALVVLLIFFRDFPLWLAVVIVGRDLLILIGGTILFKKKDIVVPSNLTGKYTFAAITFVLASYIIRFDYGAMLTTYAAIVLIAASTLVYARYFLLLRKGAYPKPFKDRTIYRFTRVVVAGSFLGIYCYRLYLFLFN